MPLKEVKGGTWTVWYNRGDNKFIRKLFTTDNQSQAKQFQLKWIKTNYPLLEQWEDGDFVYFPWLDIEVTYPKNYVKPKKKKGICHNKYWNSSV